MKNLSEQFKKMDFSMHQYMDQPSLDYIIHHKPHFRDNDFKSNFKKEFAGHFGLSIEEMNLGTIVKKYSPDSKWYLIDEESKTIHGLRHIYRTMILAYLLCVENSLDDLRILSVVSSSIHDLQRKNDMLDIKHGNRAADWFMDNYTNIINNYDVEFTEKEISKINNALMCHSKTYKTIDDKYCEDYENDKDLVDLLKSADALDRYRLPREDWWIKEKYLRLKPSNILCEFSYYMVIWSEQAYLDGKDSLTCILDAVNLF